MKWGKYRWQKNRNSAATLLKAVPPPWVVYDWSTASLPLYFLSITALASEQFLSTRLIHFREVCIIPRPYRICPRHRPHLSWTSSNGRYGGLACLCLRSICKWSRGKHQGIPRFLPIFHIMTSAHPYKNIFQRTTILLKYCTLWKMQASIWIW